MGYGDADHRSLVRVFVRAICLAYNNSVDRKEKQRQVLVLRVFVDNGNVLTGKAWGIEARPVGMREHCKVLRAFGTSVCRLCTTLSIRCAVVDRQRAG